MIIKNRFLIVYGLVIIVSLITFYALNTKANEINNEISFRNSLTEKGNIYINVNGTPIINGKDAEKLYVFPFWIQILLGLNVILIMELSYITSRYYQELKNNQKEEYIR